MVLENPPESAYGRDLRKAIWVTKRCPELAYMLRSFDTESRWMAQFGVNVKTVEFEKFQGGVRMRADIVAKWSRLEKALLWFSETLYFGSARRSSLPFRRRLRPNSRWTPSGLSRPTLGTRTFTLTRKMRISQRCAGEMRWGY